MITLHKLLKHRERVVQKFESLPQTSRVERAFFAICLTVGRVKSDKSDEEEAVQAFELFVTRRCEG